MTIVVVVAVVVVVVAFFHVLFLAARSVPGAGRDACVKRPPCFPVFQSLPNPHRHTPPPSSMRALVFHSATSALARLTFVFHSYRRKNKSDAKRSKLHNSNCKPPILATTASHKHTHTRARAQDYCDRCPKPLATPHMDSVRGTLCSFRLLRLPVCVRTTAVCLFPEQFLPTVAHIR